jgi:cell division protease FtsH
LGGRAAEQIIYGDVTTGAESDLDQVSKVALQMVAGGARPRRSAS